MHRWTYSSLRLPPDFGNLPSGTPQTAGSLGKRGGGGWSGPPLANLELQTQSNSQDAQSRQPPAPLPLSPSAPLPTSLSQLPCVHFHRSQLKADEHMKRKKSKTTALSTY